MSSLVNTANSYIIPLLWEVYGTLEIEAPTLREAMLLAQGQEGCLPTRFSSLEGSERVDVSSIRHENAGVPFEATDAQYLTEQEARQHYSTLPPHPVYSVAQWQHQVGEGKTTEGYHGWASRLEVQQWLDDNDPDR